MLNACKTTKLSQWSYSWGMYLVLHQSHVPHVFTHIYFSFFIGFSVYLVNKSQKSSDKPKHQYRLLCCRPKLKHVQEHVKENVKKMMSEQLRVPSTNFVGYRRGHSSHCLSKPAFVASCSSFGPKVLFYSAFCCIGLCYLSLNEG